MFIGILFFPVNTENDESEKILGHKGKNANAKLEKLFYTSQKH